MTEVQKPREVDLVPDQLRYTPQVKSDIILQRRNLSLAPTEAASSYTRTGTNTITFTVVGHQDLHQLLDPKSIYFSARLKFAGGYPHEDAGMLFEEIVISSNGRTIERIRNAQYIQHFVQGFSLSRSAKMKRREEGFDRCEDKSSRRWHHSEMAVNSDGDDLHTYEYGVSVAPNDGFGAAGFVMPLDGNPKIHERMDDNLGYYPAQVGRAVNGSVLTGGNAVMGAEYVMKFKIASSGLLSQDKFLPVFAMPLTIQLRLSDVARVTSCGMTKYEISRPRMHCQMLSVSQAYANAMKQRLRGPGITLNYKAWDTFFTNIDNSKQIVVPSNKQRLSKVWVLFLEEDAQNKGNKDAFRSCLQGTGIMGCGIGKPRATRIAQDDNGADVTAAECWDQCPGLLSSQFQVGAELSEAITTEDKTQVVGPAPNTGMAWLEAYLRAIGAVNGNQAGVEFWGKDLEYMAKDFCGRKLLDTFLCKYFCLCYDGEKLIGDPRIETGVSTMGNKDIVLDVRYNNGLSDGGADEEDMVKCPKKRIMFLIEYHSQVVVRDNDVSVSF